MATWKKIIVSGSNISQLSNDANYIAQSDSGVILTGSFTGSFFGDGSGLTGVTAAGTLSSSAQIATEISGAFDAASSSLSTRVTSVETSVGAGGLLSSSAQIATDISGSFTSTSGSIATDIAALKTDSGSFSTRVTDLEAFSSSLDAGFVTEAELVAATASLSASLATSITNITTTNGSFTGSFSGSYFGDGSQLQNITVDQNATVTSTFTNASTASITHNFNSRNVQVTVYDTGYQQFIPATVWSKTADVVEIHFEGTETGYAVVTRGGHIVSGSIPYENLLNVPANIVSGSGQILVVTDGTGVISGSSQIAELGANIVSSSAQIASDVSGSVTSLSSSIETRLVSIEGSVGSGGLLSSSAQIASDISGSVTDLSSSIETRLVSIEGSVGAGGLLSSSAQIASDISGSFTSVSSSIAADIASNDADIAGLNTYTSSLKSAITVAGANVTVAGNLTVSGTTTTVDSTTVNIGDNIIALNGTGATKGGLAVNDGPASGSLLWDGTNDYWVAGASGSETKIFTKGGNDGLLSGSAQIASNISGSVTSLSSSIESRLVSIEGSVGAGGLLSSSAQIASDISGSFTSVSSSIASDIEQNLTSIQTLEGKTLLSGSAQIAANISGSFTSVSSSIATDIEQNLTSIQTLEGKTLLSGSAQIGSDISGSFTSVSSSIATDIDAVEVRVSDLEAFSASLDATFATEAELNAATASLSSSIASSIAGISAGVLTSGSFTIGITDPATGSLNFPNGGKVGDIYNLADGSIDIFVPSGYVELNHNNTDFIYLDGTDAGIQIQGLYGTKNWVFGETGLSLFPGEVRVPQGSVFSGSFKSTDGEVVSGSAQIAADISGSFTSVSSSIGSDIAALVVDSGSFSTRVTDLEAFSSSLDTGFVSEAELVAATASLSSSLAVDIASNLASITTLEGKTLVSASVLSSTQQGEVKLTTNGVDGSTIDLGLQTTDTPTFAGLTVTGDLVVTGNTIEAQVTNLNVEDKYILLNSGSSTIGDSGIVFGGADGVANSGVGLFWDASYNSNDGRLGIVNSIAAGATGDQTPSYHIAGVYEGTEANAATAQADHVGNIRVESGEIYIYV